MERLRIALVSNDVGLWEWDVPTDKLDFSDLWVSLLGRDADDAPRRGQSYRDLMHPDDLAEALERLRDHFRGETERYAVCVRFRHVDGHWVWIRCRGRLTERTATGTPLRMIGLYADATAEKEAESARREAEERFRRSFEQSGVGKCLVDLNGRITRANAAFGALVGRSVNELVDADYAAITHPDDLPRCRQRFRALLEAERDAERAETWEKRYVKPDGEIVHVLQSRTALHGPDGRPTEVICHAQDLTDLKRAEEKMERQESILRHRQRMEAVGSLAGGIAHEFNNLLQAIGGYASFAMEGLEQTTVDAAEVAADVAEIQVAADRAAKLTRQMLDFSRRSPSKRTALNAREELHALERMIRPLVGERIHVRVQSGDVHGRWEADRADVQQALMNLCVNARDAMTNGGTLALSVEQVIVEDDDGASDDREADLIRGRIAPGAYVRFSVSDTGTGIPPEIRDRIFDPFFTTKPPGKGTGMGLASVYAAVEQHDGRIVVKTGPGGTRISLDLPLSGPRRAEPSGQADEDSSGGLRVLLAEDDVLVRQVAERTLLKAGWTPVAVTSGDEAVRVFREQGGRFDLLLFDMVMPGLSGREAYDRIRAEAPDIPVLFCTGYDPESDRQVALCTDLPLVYKPIAPTALVEAVNEAVGGERSTRPQRSDAAAPSPAPASRRHF
ncbi:PAS domain S-box protein [Alienimonas sp. DA493]|uniref:PAS domain-containing hybrid sensor histidine kinase/response regulator n=1 Tax=Alienimonas sp. DA493 TaxID=3373605 RepID=UPI0037549396